MTDTIATAAPADQLAVPGCAEHGPMRRTPEAAITYVCTDQLCLNAHLLPEGTPKGTITIAHTHADGTILEGSVKHDGVWDIVRHHGFGSSRNIGLYIRQSRDKDAKTWHINSAAKALRAAGWAVVITINEDDRRSFAEVEEERYERAAERAGRFEEYASNAAGRSEARYESAHSRARQIPFGQPILVGHHSQRRAERDAEHIDRNMRASIAEEKKAGYWAGRAESAAHYEAHRKNPGVTLRRIAKLEADLRRVHKWLAGQSAGGFTRDITNPRTVAELTRRQEEIEEELAYWRGIIAEAEANGVKVWSKADFKKGDFVRYSGTWYEVLRVNAKSVTIPHIHNGVGRKVVRKGDGHLDWTWTAPYDGVSGRMSAEELEEKLAAARAKKEAEAGPAEA